MPDYPAGAAWIDDHWDALGRDIPYQWMASTGDRALAHDASLEAVIGALSPESIASEELMFILVLPPLDIG